MRIFILLSSCLLLTACCRLTNHIPFIGDNSVEKSSSKEKTSHKEKRSHKHSKKNKNAFILNKSFPIPAPKEPANEMEVPEQMKELTKHDYHWWFPQDSLPQKN